MPVLHSLTTWKVYTADPDTKNLNFRFAGEYDAADRVVVRVVGRRVFGKRDAGASGPRLRDDVGLSEEVKNGGKLYFSGCVIYSAKFW